MASEFLQVSIPLPVSGDLTFIKGNPAVILPSNAESLFTAESSKISLYEILQMLPLQVRLFLKKILKAMGFRELSLQGLSFNLNLNLIWSLPPMVSYATLLSLILSSIADETAIYSTFMGTVQRLMLSIPRKALLLALIACSILKKPIACRISEGILPISNALPKLYVLVLTHKGLKSPERKLPNHINQLLLHTMGHLTIEVARAIENGDLKSFYTLINVESWLNFSLLFFKPSSQLAVAKLLKVFPSVKVSSPLRCFECFSEAPPKHIPLKIKDSPIILEV